MKGRFGRKMVSLRHKCDKQVKIYSELQKSGAQEKERFEASMWSFESRLK